MQPLKVPDHVQEELDRCLTDEALSVHKRDELREIITTYMAYCTALNDQAEILRYLAEQVADLKKVIAAERAARPRTTWVWSAAGKAIVGIPAAIIGSLASYLFLKHGLPL